MEMARPSPVLPPVGNREQEADAPEELPTKTPTEGLALSKSPISAAFRGIVDRFLTDSRQIKHQPFRADLGHASPSSSHEAKAIVPVTTISNDLHNITTLIVLTRRRGCPH